MDGYDHKDLMRELGELPPSFSIEALAHSILGRAIPVVEIGHGKEAVLYVGAHHGSESITAALLVDFLAELARLSGKGRTVGGIGVDYLLSHRKFFVVPMLNPDGVEYAVHGLDAQNPLYARVLAMNAASGTDLTHWQANARGVDLNHNYDAGFAAYKRMEREKGIFNGAPTGFSGEYPESEPETEALSRLLRASARRIRGVLTLHTQGEEILCGMPGDPVKKTESVCRLLERSTGYQRATPTGSAAFGGLTDWCLSCLAIPSFTLECGKGTNPLPMKLRGTLYERLRTALFCFPLWL